MAVNSYTKSGTKSTTSAKLDSQVFGLEVTNHDVIKQVYVAYLSNGRGNFAQTLKRGQVSGGGRKPWRQKGTGRARFGSSRNPIWRGGGVAFGPTGNENYTKKVSPALKRLALKQALSLANKSGKLNIVEDFEVKSGKTKDGAVLLTKIGAEGRVLIATHQKDAATERALDNLENVKYLNASYINVFDCVNSDSIILTKDALEVIGRLAGGSK